MFPTRSNVFVATNLQWNRRDWNSPSMDLTAFYAGMQQRSDILPYRLPYHPYDNFSMATYQSYFRYQHYFRSQLTLSPYSALNYCNCLDAKNLYASCTLFGKHCSECALRYEHCTHLRYFTCKAAATCATLGVFRTQRNRGEYRTFARFDFLGRIGGFGFEFGKEFLLKLKLRKIVDLPPVLFSVYSGGQTSFSILLLVIVRTCQTARPFRRKKIDPNLVRDAQRQDSPSESESNDRPVTNVMHVSLHCRGNRFPRAS